MHEPPRNTSRLEKSATTDSEVFEESLGSKVTGMTIDALVRYVIKLIILPALLWIGNSRLNDIQTEQSTITNQFDKLREDIKGISDRVTLLQANADTFKQTSTKDHEFLVYRLTILENAYGRIYSRLFETPNDGRNLVALGDPSNVKQFNSPLDYQYPNGVDKNAPGTGSRFGK